MTNLKEMSLQDKKLYELKIKNIIYPIEDEQKRALIISALDKIELSIHEGKIKRAFDRFVRKFNDKDYYSTIDFIIRDIFEEDHKSRFMIELEKLIMTLNGISNGEKTELDSFNIITKGS